MMKIVRSACALLVLLLCAIPHQGRAQTAEPSFGLMTAAEIGRFFPGKTFWTQGSPYRLYFSTGGRFEHQTDGTVGYVPAGRHQGVWRIDQAGNVCLNYYDQSDANACYFVLKGDDGMRPWGKFDDPVILAPAPKEGTKVVGTALPVNRWGPGNLILDDAYFKDFAAKIDSMISLRVKIAKDGKPDQAAAPDPSLSGYLNDMVGAIMVFPIGGGTYHMADGRAMTLTAEEVAGIKANPTVDQLPARAFDSLWFVDGHMQCWVSTDDARDTLCQDVHAGETLAHNAAKNAYVSHAQDGYSRVITKDMFIPLK